ncbi:EGF-like domain-containing protein [Tieghemostelium lacteum]|uniref:Alpha-mannosidase n=1 Tax=Tieghemostelium lacteum TaxID=361077 RepID=A0A151ZB55_TIELA|nr:EGF-like domain-containing protein [Tieghemostelium lacteum]|eukprot:KYQ91114.1 EGF-like domain-containing protein [Tieghemostelium lacteum]
MFKEIAILILLVISIIFIIPFYIVQPKFIIDNSFRLIEKNQLELNEDVTLLAIPHSHCDSGWIDTYEDYGKTVKEILDKTVKHLIKDKNKKFSWSEISFFKKWWELRDNTLRESVRELVRDGRLEFLGGYVQNDESLASVEDVIDQMTEGHLWLQQHFNVTPTSAWQIDPFGYSSSTPYIFSRMGYTSLVINRVSTSIKDEMKDNREMEFIWRGSKTIGSPSEILVNTLFDHYSYPNVLKPHLKKSKEKKNIKKYIDHLKSVYNTKYIMIPFGDDFTFGKWDEFDQNDRTLEFLNSRKDYYGIKEIRYATVGEYFKLVSDELKSKDLPIYDGDFFPYITDDEPWTGYYSTHPVFKRQVREFSNILKNTDIFYTFANQLLTKSNNEYNNGLFNQLQSSRYSLALAQHHDAISGTARSFVMNDYAKQLNHSRINTFNTLSNTLEVLLLNNFNSSNKGGNRFTSNNLINLEDLKNGQVLSMVYLNSLGWTLQRHISFRVYSSNSIYLERLELLNSNKDSIEYQIVPIIKPSSCTKDIKNHYSIHFKIDLPPIGISTWFLRLSNWTTGRDKFSTIKKVDDPSLVVLKSQSHSISFNGKGMIQSVSSDRVYDIQSSLFEYKTSKSGAYIFAPKKKMPYLDNHSKQTYYHVDGPLVSELLVINGDEDPCQNDNNLIYTRLYKSNVNHKLFTDQIIEVGYSLKSQGNREVVLDFGMENQINSKIKDFYTDNGIELRKRTINVEKSIEYQFYPALHYATINDNINNYQLSMFVDRSLGVSSPSTGTIEVMVHRNLLQDDSKGLIWPNRDGSRSDGKLYLKLSPFNDQYDQLKKLSIQIDQTPLLMTKLIPSISQYLEEYRVNFTLLSKEMDSNVHLYSLKKYLNSQVGLRLSDLSLTKPASVNLFDLFNSEITLEDFNERSLSFTKNINNIQDNSFKKTRTALIQGSGESIKYLKKNSFSNKLLSENNTIIDPLQLKSYYLNISFHQENPLNQYNINLDSDPSVNMNRYSYDFSYYPIDESFNIDKGPMKTATTILILAIVVSISSFLLVVIIIIIILKKKKLLCFHNPKPDSTEIPPLHHDQFQPESKIIS